MRTIRTMLRWLAGIAALVLVLVVAAVAALIYAPQTLKTALEKLGEGTELALFLIPPPLPSTPEIKEAYWLSQRWSPRDRFWFHHSSQGTATLPVPYDWFVELERGELSLLGSPGKLADSAYLARFGFISSPREPGASDAAAYGYRGLAAADTAGAAERDKRIGYPANPEGLPVGFARLDAGIDPTSGLKSPAMIGFTCAACHTGHLEYKNISLRFDGGPAMVDLGKLEPAVAQAIAYTLEVPGRLDRFIDRLIARSPEWKSQDRKDLKREMQGILDRIAAATRWAGQASGAQPVVEGYGRLDALNRIGNMVFFTDLLTPADFEAAAHFKPTENLKVPRVPGRLAGNFKQIDAPVNFPPLWDTSSALWVQYDASILNELVRNAGEGLGVGAKLNMIRADGPGYFASSIRLLTMNAMEEMLRGNPDPLTAKAFSGLAAPKWEEAVAIVKDKDWKTPEPDKAARGRDLYRVHCVECHRGPVRDPEFDRRWPEASFWNERDAQNEPQWLRVGDRSFFKPVEKKVTDMATDPQQARVLAERRVWVPSELKLDAAKSLRDKWGCNVPDSLSDLFAVSLMAVVDRTIDKWFADNPTDAAAEKAIRGPRPNCPNPNTFSASGIVPHYRARPLDGVWATAPYLHNGSVPTLQAMLTPQNERPKSFCVGSRQFDPEKVGLRTEPLPCAPGLTTFDTTELGNSNFGHSFEGTERDVTKLPRGVIGPRLQPDERDALVEYLKTL